MFLIVVVAADTKKITLDCIVQEHSLIYFLRIFSIALFCFSTLNPTPSLLSFTLKEGTVILWDLYFFSGITINLFFFNSYYRPPVQQVIVFVQLRVEPLGKTFQPEKKLNKNLEICSYKLTLTILRPCHQDFYPEHRPRLLREYSRFIGADICVAYLEGLEQNQACFGDQGGFLDIWRTR